MSRPGLWPLLALVPALAGGCRSTDGPVPGPRDAAAPPVDAAPVVTTVAPPEVAAHILPILQLTLPGMVVVETLGEVPLRGELGIIQDHDGSHTNLAARPLSFHARVGLAVRSTRYEVGARALTLQIQDDAGKPQSTGLLGLPYQGDWALLPCWSDKTCMRNLLAFAIGGELGVGAPRARFVEVYLNQAYQGLYQLVAPARQEQGRVALPAGPGDSGPALTGGYVFRRSGGGQSLPSALPVTDWVSATTAPGPYPNQLIYTQVFPSATAATSAQRTYLQGHVALFEAAMKAESWADPAQGYPAWIDVPSWQDFAVLAEVSNDADAWWTNAVLTKPRDEGGRGKLVLTPLWDFTVGFGNADYRSGWRTDKLALPTALASGGACVDPEWLPRGQPLCDEGCCAVPACRPPGRCWNMPYLPFYWERLAGDPGFRDGTRCRYKELRRSGGPLDQARIDGWIGQWKAQLAGPAMARHLEKWPDLRGAVVSNPYDIDPRTAPIAGAAPADFFEREVQLFRDWVATRLSWLDARLPGACLAGGDSPDAGVPPPALPPAPGPVELQRGLVGYWKLDEGMGIMATDSSPLGNHGTLQSFLPTDWTPMAQRGAGLAFSPARRPGIVVANAPSLNPTGGLSIALWANAADWLGNRRLVQKGDNDDQYRFLEEEGLLKLQLTGVSNGLLTALLPANNQWHHLAATWDGAVARLYVDGAIVTEELTAPGRLAVTAGNLHIGTKRLNAPPQDSFSGALDEVMVYDRGLNPTEVARLAAGTTPM